MIKRRIIRPRQYVVHYDEGTANSQYVTYWEPDSYLILLINKIAVALASLPGEVGHDCWHPHGDKEIENKPFKERYHRHPRKLGFDMSHAGAHRLYVMLPNETISIFWWSRTQSNKLVDVRRLKNNKKGN